VRLLHPDLRFSTIPQVYSIDVQDTQPTEPIRLRVIDSHTGGEPTRVVLAGGPELPGRTMAEKRDQLRARADWVRTATVLEPRGHDAVVGAMLFEPADPDCVAGVVFFNNHNYLNGCLHGTMGVAVTLAHLGKIGSGEHRLETPVGTISFTYQSGGKVTVKNVRSYRLREQVPLNVEGYGSITGDVAWGGNWFFLAEAPAGLEVTGKNLQALTDFSRAIKRALTAQQITGGDGAEIDHIEVFGPPSPESGADSRNFVLCPGNAYDRSPCGTGTSAKLACLHAEGRLAPGEVWKQAGILDTIFEGSIEPSSESGVIPIVTGTAHITAEADLLIHPNEPFAFGIPSLIS